MTRMFSHHQAIAVSLSGLAFAVYLNTLAPGVGFIDSGELAAVASTLGVAHPTGYPFFTLVGWVFAHLPIAHDVITRLNIMAAVFCAAGVFVFFHVVRRVLALHTQKSDVHHSINPAAAAASLLLAFSETYWSQALAVEVYALHVLLVGCVLLAFLRANHPLEGEHRSMRSWHLFAFLVGLSFTNHMTTIFLAPGLLFMYFAEQGWSRSSLLRLGRMLLPFFSGLSVYLYLPIRALQAPVLNWGNTVSLDRLLNHLSGWQYRVWIFSSTEVISRQLSYFLSVFPAEFAYGGIVVGIIGALMLWHTQRRLAIGVILLFATCVLTAVNYNIKDIDSYFILAYMSTALCAGVGFFAILRWIAGATGQRMVGAVLLVLAFGCANLVMHYRSVDQSDNHLVDDYTMNMFSSLDPHAVIFSYQWDYWISASYYYQFVQGVRPDVIVIDKELLRRSWYLKQLETRAPWLIAESRQEVDAFLKEVRRFERNLPYNGDVIEARYASMISSFIRKNIATRPVYATAEIEGAYTKGYQRVPVGLAFRLVPREGFVPSAFPEFVYRPSARQGQLEDVVRRLYAEALGARGEYYCLAGGDTTEARKSLEKALSFDPTSPRVIRLAGMVRHRN